MPLFGSWAELHAALTHFPIALLLVALFFDAAALALRRPAWRDIGLAILTLAVISLPISLLSGYLAGRDMGRPPVGFDQHWKAAVLTTIVAAALLAWRVRTHKRTERVPQLAMMGVALAGAVAVGYTGHMGGSMVFGGRSASSAEVAPAPPAPVAPIAQGNEKAAADKIAASAGRMSSALDRMGAATNRLAQKASSPTTPQPAAPPATVNTAPLDDAAQKMERIAARFEASAAKIEASARRIEGGGSPRVAVAPPMSQGSARGGSAGASVSTSQNKSAPDSTGKAPPASTSASASTNVPSVVPSAPAPDVRLVAGRKLFFDNEIGCAGCHKLSGEGGRSGPDLTFAGRLHPDLEWQIAHLKNPASKVPGSKMPAYADLPPADLEALATLMVSLK